MDKFMVLSLLFSSFVASVFIAFLKEEWSVLRTLANISAAIYKLFVIAYLLWAVYHGRVFEISYPMVSFANFHLRIDPLGLLFVSLSSFLWLLTTLYAVGYLEGYPNRRRFFTFFNLAVTSTMGIALAGNMFTFFLFYELLTLSTYPLVVHKGNDKSLKAGAVYLVYTMLGGTLFLVCLVFVYAAVGTGSFHAGGNPQVIAWAMENRAVATLLFYGLFFGMAVKAAVFPLHGWLTRAMVAPAPVSALLHAVAVVKAGAFGVIRLVYDLYGAHTVQALNLWQALAYLAGWTIVFGASMAVFQSELKKRLAYSTISHLSYILLGTLLPSPVATMGALLHLVNHGIMKITLFMCVGNYSEAYGVHRFEEVKGIGRKMPLTTFALTLASLGLIGLPLTAGYLTKEYLQKGAELVGAEWAVYVLYLSSLLGALYLLPIVFSAWLGKGEFKKKKESKLETSLVMLIPPLITGILTILIGISTGTPINPLTWVKLIVSREYGDMP